MAAQQFNVLITLDVSGNDFYYYGERWQSTPDGLKAHDFPYIQPLRFDPNGVVQTLNFTDSFQVNVSLRARINNKS